MDRYEKMFPSTHKITISRDLRPFIRSSLRRLSKPYPLAYSSRNGEKKKTRDKEMRGETLRRRVSDSISKGKLKKKRGTYPIDTWFCGYSTDYPCFTRRRPSINFHSIIWDRAVSMYVIIYLWKYAIA